MVKELLHFRFLIRANAISEEPKDNISSFLRKCENQAHDDWAADEYKEEKEKARGIINKIHSLILEAVKAEMPDMGDKSIDAFGLSEFLRNEDEDDEKKEEKAFGNFKPLSVLDKKEHLMHFTRMILLKMVLQLFILKEVIH